MSQTETANSLPPGFGTADPDFMKQAAAKARSGVMSDVVFIKQGVSHVRVLPPHEDAKAWFRFYTEHGLRPGGSFMSLTCPGNDGDPCPICEEGVRLYDLKGEENIAAAKRLNVKKAYLYNVYVYSAPDGQSLRDGILVMKSGVKVYEQLMTFDNDAAGDWGDITNLTSGLEFRIERKGKGRYKTEYNVMGVPTRSNILDKLEAEGLEIGTPQDLSKIYPARTYGELQQSLDDDEPEE